MSKDNQFFEDLLKLVGSATNVMLHSAGDAKKKWDALVDRLVEDLLNRKNLVSREEFEVVKEMATLARQENEVLKERIEALEKRSGK